MLGSLLLLAGLAHAEPELVEYDPGENDYSALPLKEGEGVLSLTGFSKYQLSDRLQVRTSLLGNLMAPNAGLLFDLGEVGQKGHLGLQVHATTFIPWFRMVGLVVGGGPNYTITTRNYRPDYIHLSGGVLVGGFAAFQGGGSLVLPMYAGVDWDHRINQRARLHVAVADILLPHPTGFTWMNIAQVRYSHIFGRFRVGGGVAWAIPIVQKAPDNPMYLGTFWPLPTLEASMRI